MRNVSAAMQALLNGDAVPALATFWLITRQDGVMFGFTDWTNDIEVGGVTYSSSAGGSRSAEQQRVDLATPAMEITSIIESDLITDEDIRAGKYDGATVKVFMAVPTDRDFLTYGQIILPGAYLGEITIQDGIYVAELRGLSYALSQSFIEVYTPLCRADFCDARCKLTPADFTYTGQVVAPYPNAPNVAFTMNIPPPPGGASFQYGVCSFTSGANTGFSVEIQAYETGNAIGLYLPAPYAIQAGDKISLLTGCDKTVNTCTNVYNNIVNMRAEPYIPGANFLFDYGLTSP
jgi:uncharacterized phage protein (TIGR02218 family)